jgi:predicted nuclease of predicted toxin-antitoxin system
VKFLADMGVSMATVRALREAGEDVVHLREQGLQTLPDDQIFAKAADEHRVILRFDLDFGELLAAAGTTIPSVILFRMRNQTPGAVNLRLFLVLDECRLALESGAIVIVQEGGYRLRHLPVLEA